MTIMFSWCQNLSWVFLIRWRRMLHLALFPLTLAATWGRRKVTESPDVASVPGGAVTGGNTGGSQLHCPAGQTVALCARPDGGHADTCPLLRGHTDTKGGHRWTLEGKHRGHRSHTIIQNTGRQELAQGLGGEKEDIMPHNVVGVCST